MPPAAAEPPLNVLVVEDDAATREFLCRGLAQRGFGVDAVADVAAGTARARRGDHDVIVLDVMLPDGDGFELLEALKRDGVETRVVFLSARGEVSDRLRGFELGGDDYLRKPFAFAELVARIQAVARRSEPPMPKEILQVADLSLDVARHRVTRSGRAIRLSARQFALLCFFVRRAGLVLSRSMITEGVWGHGFENRSNALDVQIKVLRDKIDRDFAPPLLHTVRGVGYVLEARGEAPERDA